MHNAGQTESGLKQESKRRWKENTLHKHAKYGEENADRVTSTVINNNVNEYILGSKEITLNRNKKAMQIVMGSSINVD